MNMEERLPGKLLRYIGDGVYLNYDGHYVWAGLGTGERIAFAPSVLVQLLGYVDTHVKPLQFRKPEKE